MTKRTGKIPFVLATVMVAISYFLVEGYVYCIMAPGYRIGIAFGCMWVLVLTGLVMLLPPLAGKILYGFTYFVVTAWAIGQTGYCQIFGKMMWLADIGYAGEGADYLGDVLHSFSALWWIGGIYLLVQGVLVILIFPDQKRNWKGCAVFGALIVAGIAGLIALPQVLFLWDDDIWGTHSEYAQSSSYEATYTTMYDARKFYNICGIYHTMAKDVWQHHLYPLTPGYRQELKKNTEQLTEYFARRGAHQDNEMTGILEGKNVILVLMESMDDWMITQEDTPTICRLMDEGINFTNFYTPGYGGARTINTEFCVNSGIYLPTNGGYVFDYVTNHFNQSIAGQLMANGYTAECFHYNEPEFYSRGAFEPALGYHAYNSFEDYVTDEDQLYDDCFLFDSPELNDLFFRQGQTFNFIITRSAHLSYKYNEVLSYYALKQYPQYRGKFGHEEIDCARVKAKLVDDMFARLMQELEAKGQLHNTVIIGVTDHYTYGFKDMDTLLKLSDVSDELLLEKTPCFVWAADCPDLDVSKTLNTSDLLPTVLNLLGIDAPYSYLGQDAFDPGYVGYALFPDGSWISDGVVFKADRSGTPAILANEKGKELTEDYLEQMSAAVLEYIRVSNLLLISDYYAQEHPVEK